MRFIINLVLLLTFAVILFIACMFFIINYAHAETLNIYLVRGSYGLDKREVRNVIEMARKDYIKKFDHDLSYSVGSINVMCDSFNTLQHISDKFNCFYDFARRKHLLSNRQYTQFIIPPLLQDNKLWIYGMAQNNFAVSVGLRKSLLGVDRKKQSATALAHEYAHMLGATHQDGVNLMNPDANKYVNAGIYPLTILKETLYQIKCNKLKECYG